MKRSLLIILLLASLSGVAQPDTTIQEVQAVKIVVNTIDTLKVPVRSNFYLSYRQIQELSPNDIGELFQKFAGISLKSYGGLGGMKTFSYRSLGSQHAALVVDGFTVRNAQTGQVNLGQMNIQNVLSVYNTSELDNLLLPVSAQLSGASFSVSTFDNAFLIKGVYVKSRLEAASFGQMGGHLSTKWTGQKHFINATGGYRQADGGYPFSYTNGTQQIDDVRMNNGYKEYYFGNSFGLKIKKSTFRLGYNYKEIEQGLPGAVVYYNSTADEQLYTKLLNVFSDLNIRLKTWRFRLYAKMNRNDLRYYDPSYLNSSGVIDVNYLNSTLSGGVNFYRNKGNLTFFGGIEEEMSSLLPDDSLMGDPLRLRNLHMFGGQWHVKKWRVKAFVGGQYVLEYMDKERDRELYRLNPVLSVRHESWKKMRASHMLTYRNSFRLPSFNELYYNNIGNNDLKPEDANQFSYEYSFEPFYKKKFSMNVLGHAFANRIDNLIIAIPTKNLFVWSMQNIGKTNAFGGDLMVKNLVKLGRVELGLDVNYTFQRTLDMTDMDSPTYKDQVAYIPIHTGNADISIRYKEAGLRLSALYIGSRYSLNENIDANRLDPFFVSDISLYYKLNIRKVNKLKLQLNCKNIFNASYAYIRSYIMPGRSYMLTLFYALH